MPRRVSEHRLATHAPAPPGRSCLTKPDSWGGRAERMPRLIPETYVRGADLPACEVAYSEAGLRVGRRPGQDGLPARLDGCMADMSRDEGGLRMHGSGVAGAVGYGEKGGRAGRRFGKRDAESLAASDGSDQRHGIFPPRRRSRPAWNRGRARLCRDPRAGPWTLRAPLCTPARFRAVREDLRPRT